MSEDVNSQHPDALHPVACFHFPGRFASSRLFSHSKTWTRCIRKTWRRCIQLLSIFRGASDLAPITFEPFLDLNQALAASFIHCRSAVGGWTVARSAAFLYLTMSDKAQDNGDSRNRGLKDPCVYMVSWALTLRDPGMASRRQDFRCRSFRKFRE